MDLVARSLGRYLTSIFGSARSAGIGVRSFRTFFMFFGVLCAVRAGYIGLMDFWRQI